MVSDNEKNHTQYADLLARIRAHCEEAIWAVLDYQSRIWRAKDTSDLKVSAGRKRNGYESWRINTTYILLTNTLSQTEDPNLAFPPATQQQIMETEQKLGFSLPPLLRLLYTEVANGGFGPGYGILGAEGGYGGIDNTPGSVAHRYRFEITFANAFIHIDQGGWKALTPEERQVLWDDGIGSRELWEAEELAGLEEEEVENPVLMGSPWPSELLPICQWGCNITTYMNVATGQIFQGMRGADLLVAASLEEWLERWLVGEQLQFL
ncbi:SMI1/KNR4 family protein [Ktedonobacter racemifer]|uniref:Cell wall assembly/cell proliferation coordinating protein, KNR4 n=1 Tax=Ktedonobacter racemifer DSM 44963 TaxID=485913 RepID=D6TZM6_KTERA|nr:SMI1/KNR4 family protein [Ktedonobacter racemifer]EFH82016.1 Cell wall assembly/cell proliferation coordinating protein, KNR4 [Ktedonobacter racemifer DSM 44963]